MGGMKKIAKLRAAAVICAVGAMGIGACQNNTGPAGPSVAGEWSGSAPDGSGGTVELTALLQDRGGAVSGNGNLVWSSAAFSCALSASGNRTGSNVSILFTCQGYEFNFLGSVSSDNRKLSGALTGSPYLSNFALTLSKTS